MLAKSWGLLLLLLSLVACQGAKEPPPPSDQVGVQILLSSSAFAEGEMIPAKYTCDGENISPPLRWGEVPAGTVSLALIAEDPDAPMGIWVHWVLYNLPGELHELEEGVAPGPSLPNGGQQGKSSFGKPAYGGPCPPAGTHRYYFRLYALDTRLELDPGADKQQVLRAMEGHILGQGQLMGRYKRS